MLWISLHFPLFPLESFLPASARSEPWAVTDGARVAVCNEHARARGIRPGMSLATACALALALNHRQRDPAAEAAALGQVAAWAVQFTPAVSLQPPRGLLLEIEGSQALAVLFRPPRAAGEASPAALRLALDTCEGDLAVRILKRRGAVLGQPIRLHPAPIVNRHRPGLHHAVDRASFLAPPARIVPAAISAL